MPLKFRWEHRTPVPPDKARAWWFDIREDDHGTPEHAAHRKPRKGDGRKVLERGKDYVLLDDTWRGQTMRTTVRLAGSDQLLYESKGKNFEYRGTMRFLREGEGARLLYESTTEGGLGVEVLGRLFVKWVNKELKDDMEIHARHMERDWAAEPW